MIQFYTPLFVLLLPLPFLIRKFFPYKNKALTKLYFPTIERLKKTFPSQTGSPNVNNFFLSLLFASWAFLIVALMQPEKIDEYKKINSKGYDLMLAVDISGSMQAVDFTTPSQILSRIDATKEVVGKFVKARKGDRVGLITFGQSAYLHVPLTHDTVAVSHMLNDTVLGMAGNGTAIGDAIGLAVRTLRMRQGDSKVLILLTDGEDNASSIPPIEAAKLAKEYGIRIYTIGVGKQGPVPFPTQFGGYAMGETSMDEGLLKQIASVTGGEFFKAEDKRSLESIYKHIDQLEKIDIEQSVHYLREPLFAYPLSISVLILLGLTLMRKRSYGF